MIFLSSFIHVFLGYILIICDVFVILHPLLLAYLFIYLDDHQYIRIFILICKWILLVFVLLLVIIGSITYAFVRTKQKPIDDVASEQSPIDPVEEEAVSIIPPEREDSVNEQIIEICPLTVEEPLKPCPSNEIIFIPSLRKLICYCDGSYSSRSRIGYSAFRASNGYNKCCRCPLRSPYGGSTESEVFAAYLALQYTAKCQYDILILYTDNVKVEQLLTRPKKQDYYDYPRLLEAHRRCSKGNEHFHIQVERVRGHTTWYEQQKCSIHREFAKVDRLVRQKRQEHERRYSFPITSNDLRLTTYFNQHPARYSHLIYSGN